jgi:uncharacterized protein
VHVQVGGFDPRDPLLDAAWGLLAEAGVPVVVHCGNGPVAGPYTGLDVFGEVLDAHPRLVAVLAHAGLPDYDDALELVRRYPEVHLDTTMVTQLPAVAGWAAADDRLGAAFLRAVVYDTPGRLLQLGPAGRQG